MENIGKKTFFPEFETILIFLIDIIGLFINHYLHIFFVLDYKVLKIKRIVKKGEKTMFINFNFLTSNS